MMAKDYDSSHFRDLENPAGITFEMPARVLSAAGSEFEFVDGAVSPTASTTSGFDVLSPSHLPQMSTAGSEGDLVELSEAVTLDEEDGKSSPYFLSLYVS